MFYVETSGSYYEMGRRFGRATRLAIGSIIDFTGSRFRDWDEAKFKRARERHMAYTEKLCPELIEEVTGIADGSGFPFQRIYLASFYASMGAGGEECSNFIFTETPEGPLLASTVDLPVHEGKHAGVRLARPKGEMAFLGSAWPGTVWVSRAINEAGLAIGGSSCSASVPAPENFINPHVTGRFLLKRAETVADAIKLLKEIPFSTWGSNRALLDKSGAAAIVEKAGTFQGIRRPEGKRIWCTNHSVSPEMLPYRINDPEGLKESTERFEAIDRLTRDSPLSAEVARKVLAYDGRPGAVCRYGDRDPVHSETEFAGILFPAAGRSEYCFSHAGRDPWHGFSLDGPIG